MNAEYVLRRIRENHVTGSSCTFVLCGLQTPSRRYVDWEIKATLDKQHGLVGVLLPTNPTLRNGGTHKPGRLQDNINSGYAPFVSWTELIAGGPVELKEVVENAIALSKNLIRNWRPLRHRNG